MQLETAPALETGFPANFPYTWAHDWGEDERGIWVAFVIAGVRQALRWIPPGSFMMGSPDSEKERFDREVLHQVTLSRGFWLGETTVTQALWQAVMHDNPSRFKGDDLPVEQVSWLDADAFIARLNGLQAGLNLRLPSEAEWEYACRAGTATPFSFGKDLDASLANFNGNYPYGKGRKGEYREKTVAVSAFPANPWGLYQMHGNVWEWCNDWFADYPKKHVRDPKGPATGAGRVLRGGSWLNFGRSGRSAYRVRHEPGRRDRDVGFRLARGQSS